jgi:hypothetical protein
MFQTHSSQQQSAAGCEQLHKLKQRALTFNSNTVEQTSLHCNPQLQQVLLTQHSSYSCPALLALLHVVLQLLFQPSHAGSPDHRDRLAGGAPQLRILAG